MHDEKIEERLQKLEKRNKSAGRFFTQYILAPILVVAIGFVFNIYLNQTKEEIEHKRIEMEQIQLADKMIDNLFSDDVYKINASKALIEYVLIDSRVRDAMIAIVDAYLDEIKQKSEQEGDFDSLYALYDSARSYGGESNEEIVKVFEADSSFVDRKVEYETIQKEQRIIEGLIVEGEVDKAIEKLNLIEGSVEKDFSFLNPEQTSPLSTFQIPSLESMNERLNEAISESLERQ